MGDKVDENRGVAFSLFENAMDSIQHAIEHYLAEGDPPVRRYKYAILHLSQGVALLLKERLRQEHPNFVFVDVAGMGKTIDMQQTIDRLKAIANIDLADSSALLRQLASLRNGIEHFSIDLSRDQADSLISQAIPFLVNFVRYELKRDFEREIGDGTWQALQTIKGYHKNAIERARRTIESRGMVAYHCPKCQSEVAAEMPRSYPVLSGYRLIQCLVCLDEIMILTSCINCEKGMSALAGEPFMMSRRRVDPYSVRYVCEECTARWSAEFSEFGYPVFAGLVNKKLNESPVITTREMEECLFRSGISAGPTGRPGYLHELYRRNLVDFAYENDRTEYLSQSGPIQYMFAGNYTLKAGSAFRRAPG